MKDELIILKSVPKVKWTADSHRPICIEHNFELDEGYIDEDGTWEDADWTDGWIVELRCLEGPHIITLPMAIGEMRRYIHKKIESKQYADAKLIDLDGLLVPVSKEKVTAGESDYFVTSQLKSGKRGDQVVIYAGKKGSKNKSQIFVDPEHKRMSFDQNNLNPTDVFVKVEATFKDSTKHTIKSGKEK